MPGGRHGSRQSGWDWDSPIFQPKQDNNVNWTRAGAQMSDVTHICCDASQNLEENYSFGAGIIILISAHPVYKM